MTPSRMRLVVLAALVCGAAVVALALTSDHQDPAIVWAIFGPAVGWGFIGTGLYAWRRRPESRTGMLMVLLGFAWFLSAVSLSNVPLVYTSGAVIGGLWGGVFLQLELAFPSGRLGSRTDRVLAIAGYLLFTARDAARDVLRRRRTTSAATTVRRTCCSSTTTPASRPRCSRSSRSHTRCCS